MPLEESWPTLPNLTLIGDAAHIMPPYAGEGVNMAMLDALELAHCLLDENSKDIPTALATDENQMHLRFAEVGKETMENTAWMHSPNGLDIIVNFFSHAKEGLGPEMTNTLE